MKTEKDGNGALTRRTAKSRRIRISFAHNGKAKDIKIWMRFWTRTDPNFL